MHHGSGVPKAFEVFFKTVIGFFEYLDKRKKVIHMS